MAHPPDPKKGQTKPLTDLLGGAAKALENRENKELAERVRTLTVPEGNAQPDQRPIKKQGD